MLTKSLTLGVALVILISPSVAAAASAGDLVVAGHRAADEDFTIRVPYNDLQLASASDAQMLRDRVSQASLRSCRGMYRSYEPSYSWECQATAMRIAAPQIANAIDSARHGGAVASTSVVLRFVRR